MSQQPFNSDGGFSTTGNTSSGNITVTASHGNLVLGDATATGSPGLSSTTSVILTAGRGTTDEVIVFDTTGNLSVPGTISTSGSGGNITMTGGNITGADNITANNISLNNGHIQSGTTTTVTDGINAIYQGTSTTMDVYGFPFTTTTRGQLTISGITTPAEANGTWYYQSTNTNVFALYTDSTYTTTVDSTAWAAYTGGGSVSIQQNLPMGNVVISANGFLTTFSKDGNLTFPNASSFNGYDLVAAPNSYIEFGSYNANTWMGVDPANAFIQTDFNNNNYAWVFDNTGNLTLPVGGDLILSSGNIVGDGASPAPSINGFDSVGAVTVSATANVFTPRVVNGGSGMYIDAGYPGYINFFNSNGTTVTINDAGNINGGNISATGTITSNGNTNGTAFAVVGNGAVSNVALGFFPTGNTPAQMAIRDYSTANSVMYFDTTVGSANTGGQFIFRGSNAYTTYASINSHGVSQPTKPAFRVYGNGVTTGLSTTTNGTGVLNGNNWAVDYNQGGYLNSTTGVFTAPVAGLYQINLVARVVNNTAPTAQAQVLKNGNVNQAMWESGGNCTTNHFGVGTVSNLAVGDTLTLKVSVGALTFDINDNWSVAFLG